MQKLEAMSPPPLIILPVWSSNWNGQQFYSWICVRHLSPAFPRVTILASVLHCCAIKHGQVVPIEISNQSQCEALAAKIQKAFMYDVERPRKL
jgi:hypothetical protein